MSTYVLRDVPPDLWARVQSRLKQDGRHLRPLVLQLLEAYADGRITLAPEPALDSYPDIDSNHYKS